ncbi:MAG: cyclic nucleotide-binding domain-containing protein [Spirochaetes bacterium]|nr:cyclic nucleotide-binding domain-containing protein [Spirochaetota bacterium]
MFNKELIEKYSKSFKEGQIIFTEGSFGREMYILLEGEVEIYREIDGKKRVLAVLKKGDFFGEMSIIDKFPRSASACAKTNITVIVINGILFAKLLQTNIEFSIKIIKMLISRLRNTNEIIVSLYNKDREDKVISAINEFFNYEVKDPNLKNKKMIPKDQFIQYCEKSKNLPKNIVVTQLNGLKSKNILDYDNSGKFIFCTNIDRRYKKN